MGSSKGNRDPPPRETNESPEAPDWRTIHGFPLDSILPTSPQPARSDDLDVPWHIELLGDAGLVLAVLAILLTLLGLTLLIFTNRILGFVLLTTSLVLITLAMLLAILYHGADKPTTHTQK